LLPRWRWRGRNVPVLHAPPPGLAWSVRPGDDSLGRHKFNFRLPTVIASAAKQSIVPRKERMDCFVASLLAMTANGHSSAISRRNAPELYTNLPPKEGVGNAGCPVHPQPRVRMVVINAHEYSQRVHRNRPAFPHAMVLTASFELSLVTGSFATIARGIVFHELDASVGASGPHDFAVRVRATSKAHPRPPHPASRP
jgi:hypothetical protein